MVSFVLNIQTSQRPQNFCLRINATGKNNAHQYLTQNYYIESLMQLKVEMHQFFP